MATLTVYVVAPLTTYTKQDTNTSSVATSPAGHIFYSVDKGDGNGAKSFGFAPAKNAGLPPIFGPVAGEISTTDVTSYSTYKTYSINITGSQADALIEHGTKKQDDPGTYNLYGGNVCIDLTLDALKKIGIDTSFATGPGQSDFRTLPVQFGVGLEKGLSSYANANPDLNPNGVIVASRSPGFIDGWTYDGDGGWYKVGSQPNMDPATRATKPLLVGKFMADPLETEGLNAKRQQELNLQPLVPGQRRADVDPALDNPLASEFASAIVPAGATSPICAPARSGTAVAISTRTSRARTTCSRRGAIQRRCAMPACSTASTARTASSAGSCRWTGEMSFAT